MIKLILAKGNGRKVYITYKLSHICNNSCLYIHVCVLHVVYVHVQACICPCRQVWRPQEDIGVLLYPSPPYSHKIGSLPESGVRPTVSKPQNFSSLCLHSIAVVGECIVMPCLAFYVRAEDLNSGLNTCIPSVLPCQVISPALPASIIKKLILLYS